ncbi:MAG: GTP-binding protein [Bacteroidota bacterium]
MDLLRFLTAGSVDDGKSTLIGRLLYDSEAVSGDILEAIERSTKNREEGVDLSLLTDGLRAEREQGITIDVAYKYFSTPKRKFIIADAPGHVQYTRNMVTAASTANLVVILVDARHGVAEQTRRHSIIASLLGIPHVVVAINKMDLVNFDEQVYQKIVSDYTELAEGLGITDLAIIPVSARDGDNVVTASSNMPWYTGPTLLSYLEDVEVSTYRNETLNRLQVQYVIRPMTDELHDYRGYAGSVLSGSYSVGDVVTVLPSGQSSRIKAIESGGKDVTTVSAPQAVTIQLEDDIDISRGDTLVSGTAPHVEQELEATICWMDSKPLVAGSKWLLQHKSKRVKAVVKEILHQVDIATLEKLPVEGSVALNSLCRVRLKTSAPLVFDEYKINRELGSAILIDETANTTSGAVIIG